MFARLIAWLVFVVLMTLSIAGSTLVVVFLYLPMVALKAFGQMLRGKPASPPSQDSQQSRVPSA